MLLGGRYKILEQIGKGGFGVTFLAEDTHRPGNPKCVVKQFQPMIPAPSPSILQKARNWFSNEAQILEKLGKQHDQIPQLLAHFEENQEFYLVQEYIADHDLSQELLPGKKHSEAYVIKLLQDILQILTFVHQQRVIHRDIKPSNIRRRQDGKIVLIDFGAVKEITTQVVGVQAQTIVTIAVGTPGYMPSEQAASNPNFCSDIYALGIIGIQALTGIVPTQLPKDANTSEIIWRNQAQVSPKLADILDTMVRYDFRQRYQSAELALKALQKLSPPPQNPNPRPWQWLIFLATLAVATTAIIAITRSTTSPPVEIKSYEVEFKPYENSEERINIKYPETWDRQDIQNPITKETVRFLSKKQNDADKFQEQLTIRIEDFSGTLDDSKETFIKDINNNSAKEKILNTSATTLARKPAYQLTYTVQNEDKVLKNLQVWTLKGGKAYILIYTATIDDYDKFVQTAQTMIQSFEIN